MSHAEKCPICNGTGKIIEDTKSTLGFVEKTCHGCGGKGWIELNDGGWYPYPYNPIYPWWPPYTITYTVCSNDVGVSKID